jgi:hypothetical protein
MRNLRYPLNWDEIFDYIGFPAFLKPHAGGGWKHVYHVHNPAEFFAAYDSTGDFCMTLQKAVDFTEYLSLILTPGTRPGRRPPLRRRGKPRADRNVLERLAI